MKGLFVHLKEYAVKKYFLPLLLVPVIEDSKFYTEFWADALSTMMLFLDFYRWTLIHVLHAIFFKLDLTIITCLKITSS
jgi:hypothetical protein